MTAPLTAPMTEPSLGTVLFGFPDRDTEAGFRTYHHRRMEFRIIFLLSAAVILAYGILDTHLFGVRSSAIIAIRLALVFPFTGSLLAMTWHRSFNRLSTIMLSAAALAAAWSVTAMEYLGRGNPYAGLYFFGVGQVLIAYLGFGKVPVAPAFAVGMGMILPAIAVDALLVESDPNVALTKAIFMVTMVVLGVVSTGLIQLASRRNYISHKEIERLSITDHLTGLPNRRYFYTVVHPDLERHARRLPDSVRAQPRRSGDPGETESHHLYMVDIDHFKTINDRYGHAVGDRVLAELAARFHSMIRASDVAVRWGGEEFLIMLKHSADSHARRFPEQLREAVCGTPFRIDHLELSITISGGYLPVRRGCLGPDETVERLLSEVDAAMYRSKAAGRDRFTFADPAALDNVLPE